MYIETYVRKQNLDQSHSFSHYDGGNLFDSERYILSMVNGEEDYEIIQAESTRLPIYIASIREETFDTIRHENIF